MSGTEPGPPQPCLGKLLLCLTGTNNVQVGSPTVTEGVLSVPRFFCFCFRSHFRRSPLKRHLNPRRREPWGAAGLRASAPSNLPCRGGGIGMGDAGGEQPLAATPGLCPAHDRRVPAPGQARGAQAAPTAAGSIPQGLDGAEV